MAEIRNSDIMREILEYHNSLMAHDSSFSELTQKILATIVEKSGVDQPEFPRPRPSMPYKSSYKMMEETFTMLFEFLSTPRIRNKFENIMARTRPLEAAYIIGFHHRTNECQEDASEIRRIVEESALAAASVITENPLITLSDLVDEVEFTRTGERGRVDYYDVMSDYFLNDNTTFQRFEVVLNEHIGFVMDRADRTPQANTFDVMVNLLMTTWAEDQIEKCYPRPELPAFESVDPDPKPARSAYGLTPGMSVVPSHSK